ncbi:hypothetical protein Tco_0857220 [Tanacetum coccineum]|uniref:Uncharacterized protein n=1 Tax=Tanacetum coccineum TaxID=301880 RepID=A0ABQ5B6P3_9ASTR
MKESKAYKTYLGYATSDVPPKIARKFKKVTPSKKDHDLVPVDEEPVQKGKRVKRPAKKSKTTPTAGIVIKKTPMETNSKRKQKVDVARGKGIELIHPSGSGRVAKKPPSVEKIKPTVTSEGTSDKPGVPDVTKDDSTESEAESWGNDEDENNDENDSVSSEQDTDENESDSESDQHEKEEEVKEDDKEEDEFDHTPSHTDDKDDVNLVSKSDDEVKGDEEKGMDDTTNQFNDDVGARVNEPTQTDKEVVQDEENDAEMIDAQQGNENIKIAQEQVVEDAHVTISTVAKKTEVLVASSSHSSDLASKFLNFSDIHPSEAEIVSLLDVPVHHEVLNTQSTTLLPIHVLVIITIPQSSQTVVPPPLLSTPTPLPTIETTNTSSTIPDFASVL